MNSVQIFTLILCLTGLTACSTAYPVVAVANKTDERFFGKAVSVMAGKSRFEMTSADGVVCNGEYTAEVVWSARDPASTAGYFICSDGRKGTYSTVGTVNGGQGAGKFSTGEKFKIYYGQFATFQQIN